MEHATRVLASDALIELKIKRFMADLLIRRSELQKEKDILVVAFTK